MVRVNAPALSLEASGKLAGAIVFSCWKGRAYVRELVIPANPCTGPQVGMRSMIRFLSQIWAGLSSSDKADWLTRAKQTNISNFNAFVAYNQDRWRRFLGPSKLDPATEASTGLTISAFTATGSVRQCTLAITPSAGTNLWCYTLHRKSTSSVTPTFDNCVRIIVADGANQVSYVDTPLAPGTYYYKVIPLNVDGKKGTASTEQSGTVT